MEGEEEEQEDCELGDCWRGKWQRSTHLMLKVQKADKK